MVVGVMLAIDAVSVRLARSGDDAADGGVELVDARPTPPHGRRSRELSAPSRRPLATHGRGACESGPRNGSARQARRRNSRCRSYWSRQSWMICPRV